MSFFRAVIYLLMRCRFGKPDIIYVKNFASLPDRKTEKEVVNVDAFTEVKNFALNYNNTNYTEQNYTDRNYINPINRSEGTADNLTGQESDSRIDVIDTTNETGAYMALIRDNLEYEHHMKYDSHNDREMFEEIYEMVCDIVCVKRNTIRINGEEYPYELVKSRFLKLNSSHECGMCGLADGVLWNEVEKIQKAKNGKTTIPTKTWKTQYDKLTAERKTLNQRYLALKKEVKEAEKIRKSVYSILRQENREQQPRRAQDMER